MAPTIRKTRTPDDILAVLDVGTSKVTCLVAARGGLPGQASDPEAGGQPAAGMASPMQARVLGIGHQRSHGIKAGVVTDLADAEQCIRHAIGEAEKAAGIHVDSVVLAVACGRLRSSNFVARGQLGQHPLNEVDIARVMAAGQSYVERDGRRLVHLNRINWRLDGHSQVREPRGMRGKLLEADLHAVTAEEAPLRNLVIAVERAYVKVASVVATPFASGIAVTTPDERRYGVTVVDIGAGIASIAYFAEGHLVNAEVVTLGGGQVTYDIARNLTIPLAEAERIKTLYGTLVATTSDELDFVPYAQMDAAGGAGRLSRGALRRIILARVEDMLRFLRMRIDANRFAPFASGRVVLTGGASQVVGCAEAAATIMARPVRIGVPRMNAPHAALSAPAFATPVGVLQAMFVPGACVLSEGVEPVSETNGRYLEQVGSWLRESF